MNESLRISRRSFLTQMAGGTAALMLTGCNGINLLSRKQKPNVIILLADDMGYADPSCFGGTAVKTPHLDRLARSGVKLENFYAPSAVCTPSRAAILTGKYPLRFDIRKHFADDEAHLPREATTLPELLKEAGYTTGHLGKWHLGGLRLEDIGNRANSVPGPLEHGFDYYLCQIEGNPPRADMFKKRILYRQGGTCLLRNDKQVGPYDPYYHQHYTDINGLEAVRLIKAFHKTERPFFLNMSWMVPHTPYEPAPEPFWSATAAEGISDDQHRFRSMVVHMDHHVGRILDTLDELGIRDNTLVFFTSDNGGAYEANVGPYKGGKTDLHEAGLRVPAMVSWPGHIRAGVTSGQFGHGTDILPTVCAAVGIKAPADIDGQNLLPHLTKDAKLPDRGTVFWQLDLYPHLQRHYPKPKPYSKEIARNGKWKLLCFDGQPKELFDLEADPLEKNNVLDQYPEIVSQLKAELDAWLKEPRLSPYED